MIHLRPPAARTRVAILGAGVMGQRHARVFAGLPDHFELAGVYDTRPDAAERIAAAYDAHLFRDEAHAVARADLVVVATPIAAHAAAAHAALAAGRHVLVEKPITARAADAFALVSLAAKVDRQLFVGHSERFNPVVRALARLLRGDAIAALDFRRIGPQSGRGGQADVGVLCNLGVHDFDLAAYLGGSAVLLREAVGRAESRALEDLAHVLISTESGIAGHVYVDRMAAARERRIAVTTASWSYEGDLLSPRLTRTSRGTGTRSEVPLPAEEPLVAQALAVADALAGGAPRELAIGADGARALDLAERAASRVRAAWDEDEQPAASS